MLLITTDYFSFEHYYLSKDLLKFIVMIKTIDFIDKNDSAKIKMFVKLFKNTLDKAKRIL